MGECKTSFPLYSSLFSCVERQKQFASFSLPVLFAVPLTRDVSSHLVCLGLVPTSLVQASVPSLICSFRVDLQSLCCSPGFLSRISPSSISSTYLLPFLTIYFVLHDSDHPVTINAILGPNGNFHSRDHSLP